jgi:hypothetical protein
MGHDPSPLLLPIHNQLCPLVQKNDHQPFILVLLPAFLVTGQLLPAILIL